MEKSRLGLGLLLAASISGACLVGCGGDDTTTTGPGAGGAGGAGGGGSAGKGGSGGGATGGNAGTGGGGTAGMGGTGGNRTDAGDSGPCTKPGITKQVPTPPAAIAAPAGVTLIGGYYAEGQQIYTCVPNPAADGGAGDGGSADAAPPAGGTWANTAEAIVYGDTCQKAADHGYTATPGSPFWKSIDGSQVVATRQAATAAPLPDGGDGGAVAITWVLLKATSNTGEGVFANVTYIQRLNTTGGVGPSGACEPGDANPVRRVDYTAVYYFYTGGNSEGGTTEGGTTEGGATEGGATEAGGD
jgi:hypothetical protein